MICLYVIFLVTIIYIMIILELEIWENIKVKQNLIRNRFVKVIDVKCQEKQMSINTYKKIWPQ